MSKKEKIVFYCERIIYWSTILIPFALSFSSALLNIILGLLITAYFFKKALSGDYRLGRTAITLPFTFLMLISIISIRDFSHWHANMEGLGKLLKFVFSFTIFSECVVDLKHFKRIVISLMLGLLFVAIDGVYQLQFGVDFIRREAYDLVIGIPRLKAAFPHTNLFALYLGLVSPLGLSLALYFYQGKKKLFFAIISILAVFCLVFTFCRGAIIGFLLAVILMAVLQRDKLLLMLIAIAVITGPFMLPSTVKDWVKSQNSFVGVLLNSSGRDRDFIYKTTVNMIKHHPLIGVGVNTFCVNYPLYKVNQIEGNTGNRQYYAHNNFLHLAGETGLIGLGIFFWLLFALFRKWYIVHKSLKSKTFLQACSAGLFCGIVGFLINGMTESGLYYSKTAAIFWIVVGIMLALFKMKEEGAGPNA